MNQQTTVNFIEKMLAAKQMELEAVTTLLPDKMRGHLDVIGREVKSMLTEGLVDIAQRHASYGDAGHEEGAAKTTQVKVKKVDID
jgi:hypothetical protein